MKSKFYKYILYIILILIIIIVTSILLRVNNNNTKQNYQLKTDGLCVLHNLITNSELKQLQKYLKHDQNLKIKEFFMKSHRIKQRIQHMLGKDYAFHDYIFLIKKSQIHTCHRDYNGDLFNEGQRYPSYTIIVYLENMKKCLDIIPKSHTSIYKNAVNLTDPTETVLCKAGDALLFNANLIHTGAINDKEDNPRVQMKISHTADHKTLGFYQNYNKIMNKSNSNPKWLKQVQKHFSCQFPIVGTYTQTADYNNVTTGSGTGTSLVGQIYSKFFYGDPDFYKLPDLKPPSPS